MKPRIEPKVILALTLFLHSATHAQQFFPGPATTPVPPGLSEMPWTFGLDPSPPAQEVVSMPLPGERIRPDRSFRPGPLAFERNEGQVDAEARFLARGPGYHLYLTPAETVMVLSEARASGGAERLGLRQSSAALRSRGPDPKAPEGWRSPRPCGDAVAPPEESVLIHVLRMRLFGANPAPSVRGEDELRGKVNYFLGNDPSRWRTNISTFAKVRFEEVYPGIGLVYYGNDGRLEYDFIVAPGADAHQIALAFDGADEVALDDAGELVLRMGEQQLRWRKPLVYQQVQGARHEIAGAYRLDGRATEQGSRTLKFVSFELAAYDRTQPLVIDPALVWGTFLGSSDENSSGSAIGVDRNGNAYITGVTWSAHFPTRNPLQASQTGTGRVESYFVTKLDATGQIVYSTYIGPVTCCSSAYLAVDSAGSVYLIGVTDSSEFPVINAVQPTQGGGKDAFALKLSPEGSALSYSTYLGGSANEGVASVAVDNTGNAYVCGYTYSGDFPTANAFQSQFAGGPSDGFVTKLNPSGTALVYSTFLGGSDYDFAYAIAIDDQGSAYVGGTTASRDFPTQSAYQSEYGGGTWDGFFGKLSSAGDSLLFSSYFGGTRYDYVSALTVGKNGDVYLAGETTSADLHTTNAIQPQYRGRAGAAGTRASNAFVARYNPSSNSLVFSTYLGGTGALDSIGYASGDRASGVASDAADNVYLAGDTRSTDFPTTTDALQRVFASSAGYGPSGFLSVLPPDGSKLVYSSYLGGSGADRISAVALDRDGDVYVTGSTSSTDFPVPSPILPYPGIDSAFVVKFSPILVPPPLLQFTGSLTISNGLFRMRLTGPSGSNVVVEASDNSQAWTPIQTNVLSPTGLDLSVPLGTNQTQFFRARLAP